MAKTHTNICIDQEAFALAKSHQLNLSKFVNDSIYAAYSDRLPDEDKQKIPITRILEQRVRELTLKLEGATAEVEKAKQEYERLVAKYNRVARRKTSSFSLMAPVPRNSELADPSSKVSGQ